jgi:hypothetical protein
MNSTALWRCHRPVNIAENARRHRIEWGIKNPAKAAKIGRARACTHVTGVSSQQETHFHQIWTVIGAEELNIYPLPVRRMGKIVQPRKV